MTPKSRNRFSKKVMRRQIDGQSRNCGFLPCEMAIMSSLGKRGGLRMPPTTMSLTQGSPDTPGEMLAMFRATKDIMLPTTITGSLPRPSWYTENLGPRSFLDAMVNNQFREQYVDTVSVYLHEQEMAGLDIVTDGDAHFDLSL